MVYLKKSSNQTEDNYFLLDSNICLRIYRDLSRNSLPVSYSPLTELHRKVDVRSHYFCLCQQIMLMMSLRNYLLHKFHVNYIYVFFTRCPPLAFT